MVVGRVVGTEVVVVTSMILVGSRADQASTSAASRATNEDAFRWSPQASSCEKHLEWPGQVKLRCAPLTKHTPAKLLRQQRSMRQDRPLWTGISLPSCWQTKQELARGPSWKHGRFCVRLQRPSAQEVAHDTGQPAELTPHTGLSPVKSSEKRTWYHPRSFNSPRAMLSKASHGAKPGVIGESANSEEKSRRESQARPSGANGTPGMELLRTRLRRWRRARGEVSSRRGGEAEVEGFQHLRSAAVRRKHSRSPLARAIIRQSSASSETRWRKVTATRTAGSLWAKVAAQKEMRPEEGRSVKEQTEDRASESCERKLRVKVH